MRDRTLILRLDPAATDGGAGTGSTGDPDAAAKAMQSLLTKHNNDANAVILTLLSENRDYRATNRDLKAKIPPDGHATLPASEVDALTEYRKLGKPDELSAALAERAKATAELESIRRAETVREAASLAGFRPNVLATLVKAEGLELAITQDAKGVRSVAVKDGDKTSDLRRYVDQNCPELLPALLSDGKAKGTPNRDDSRATIRPGDTARQDGRSNATSATVGNGYWTF